MIPKIIHYCWFGDKPIPDSHRNFINGWKKLLPDYKFILWNEANSPINKIPYLKRALENRKWANLSNYMRLFAIYNYGGVYLDTDFQMIRNFDPLLENKCFFGLQLSDLSKVNSVNNAIMGAIPKHWFVKKLLEAIEALYDGLETAYLSSPHLTTYLLKLNGYLDSKYIENFDADITLYTKEYFYPYKWDEEYTTELITNKTFAVHHWEASWTKKENSDNRFLKDLIKKITKFF